MQKLVWIVEKAFDVAPDTATWLEVIRALQNRLNVYLVTGFRHHKKKFPELNNEIVYFDSIKIPYFNRFSTYLSMLRNVKALAVEYSPDIVLLNTSNLFLVARLESLKRKYGFKVFLDVRTLPVRSYALRLFIENQLFNINLRYASKALDGISYITEEMERYCKIRYRLTEHYSGTWSSGVNTAMFKPLPNITSEGPLKLIYHGSVSRGRGLETLVEGVHIATRNSLDVSLTFLGGGNAVDMLQRKVADLHLSKVVFFHGQVPIDRVPSCIAEADAGVIPLPKYPAWNVSSPIKLYEYFASGKPVIVTKIPAHKNVVGERAFAFWIDEDNPASIARAIEAAYSHKEKLDMLGNEARQFAVANCTWKKQADRLFEFLLMVS